MKEENIEDLAMRFVIGLHERAMLLHYLEDQRNGATHYIDIIENKVVEVEEYERNNRRLQDLE